MIRGVAVCVAVAVMAAERTWEMRISRRNEEALRSRGALERGSRRLYAVMVMVNVLWLLGTLVEGLARGRFRGAPRPPLLAVVVLTWGVRWWTMKTLGDRWTVRVMVVPGSQRIRSGPYRLVNHPNYLAAAFETAAFPLALNAGATAAVLGMLNSAFLWVKSREEERALDEFSGS